MKHKFEEYKPGFSDEQLHQCRHCDLTVRNTELFLNEPCPGESLAMPAPPRCRHCGCANPFGGVRP